MRGDPKRFIGVALLALASVAQGGAVERKLLGRPPDEPVQRPIDIRSVEASVLERRQLGWKVVETVTRPTALAGETADVPYWFTWYTSSDFMTIFSRIIAGLDGPQWTSRGGFSPAEIESGIDSYFGTLEEHATWEGDAFTRARSRVPTTAEANAWVGRDLVFYSPAALAHLLGQYGSIYDCGIGRRKDCITRPFPAEAIIVKPRWQDGPVDVHDTDPASIRELLETDNPTWIPRRTIRSPDGILTARTENGDTSFLVGLHIMIKTLPEWVWVTIWWSPAPDTDFGADRPASLTGVWANYKMCVVVGFDEKQHADDALGESMRLVSQGPQTWCSNPYLAPGPGNAASNCLGCHQHAGSRHHPPKQLVSQNTRQGGGKSASDHVWAIQTESPLPIMDFLVNMIGPGQDESPAGR